MEAIALAVADVKSAPGADRSQPQQLPNVTLPSLGQRTSLS